MYEMRPAAADDRPAISALVKARDAWMREYGLDATFTDGSAVRDLAGESEDGRPLAWVFCEDGTVLGCTALLRMTPGWGWTKQQREEPALLLTGTYTHPAHRGDKLGRLMAWWALDYAARLVDVQWIRRIAFADRLMRYYRDDQGWDLVDTVVRNEKHAHLMQRRPEEIRGLHALIASPATSTAAAQ